MAMISCRECKAEISSEAEICPRCGARQPNAARGRLILVILILVVAVVAIGRCNKPAPQPEARRSPTPLATQPSQREPEITDHALAVCRSLRNAGASECELTVFSQAIDARVNVS